MFLDLLATNLYSKQLSSYVNTNNKNETYEDTSIFQTNSPDENVYDEDIYTTNTYDESIYDEYESEPTSENECTDGNDDGKIGFFESVKSIFKGAVNGIKEKVSGFIENIKEHPLQTIGIALATTAACILGGPLVVAGLGAIGLVAGTIGVVKGVSSMSQNIQAAKNATTDAEAKDALENVGSDVVDVTGNAIMAVTSGATALKAANTLKAAKAAKAATNYIDDAAKISAETTDDAARLSQTNINDLKTKYRNGDLSEDEFLRLINDEYAKIRSTGPYQKNYTNNFSDDIQNIQSAIDYPNNQNVRLLKQNGWTFRKVNEIPGREIGQRMSLNVKGDSKLIQELDDLMATGRYVDDAGNVFNIKKTDFYYKTYQNASNWGLREDPITIYFRGNINDETINAVGQIASKYARGALNSASKEVPFMIIEQNPSSSMIYNLIQKAMRINPNLGKAILSRTYTSNNGTYYQMSSGQYNAYWNILNEYMKYIGYSAA